MLDLRYVSESLPEVKSALARRGFTDATLLDRLSELAGERKAVITKVEALRQQRNDASAAMAKVADKKSEEFNEKRQRLRSLGDEIKAGETKQAEVEAELERILLNLPNIPHPDTPDGLSEDDNVEVRVWGEAPSFDFDVRDHVFTTNVLGAEETKHNIEFSGALTFFF